MAAENSYHFGPGVLEAFRRLISKDRELRRMTQELQTGSDLGAVNAYADRLGDLLWQAFDVKLEHLKWLTSENALEALSSSMQLDRDLIAEIAQGVQQRMYERAGVKLRAIKAEYNADAIRGVAQSVSGYQDIHDPEAQRSIKELLQSYGMGTVDDTIRRNAPIAEAAGLEPQIIRTTEAHSTRTRRQIVRGRTYTSQYEVPCQWCQELAGTYTYVSRASMDDAIFRRHKGCRCTCTYRFRRTAQDAWDHSHTWQVAEERAREAVKQAAKEQATKEEAAEARKAAVERITQAWGWSAKRAAITYNRDRELIEQIGLDAYLTIYKKEGK